MRNQLPDASFRLLPTVVGAAVAAVDDPVVGHGRFERVDDAAVPMTTPHRKRPEVVFERSNRIAGDRIDPSRAD